MQKKEKEYLRDVVECEGFDYAFAHYTAFENVKDEEFHRLRKAYLDARKALIDYTGVDG